MLSGHIHYRLLTPLIFPFVNFLNCDDITQKAVELLQAQRLLIMTNDIAGHMPQFGLNAG